MKNKYTSKYSKKNYKRTRKYGKKGGGGEKDSGWNKLRRYVLDPAYYSTVGLKTTLDARSKVENQRKISEDTKKKKEAIMIEKLKIIKEIHEEEEKVVGNQKISDELINNYIRLYDLNAETYGRGINPIMEKKMRLAKEIKEIKEGDNPTKRILLLNILKEEYPYVSYTPQLDASQLDAPQLDASQLYTSLDPRMVSRIGTTPGRSTFTNPQSLQRVQGGSKKRKITKRTKKVRRSQKYKI